ncbi:hypothetical protein [Salmonirosea aquatica]|uniref:Uncharacterized protein n=1 Tax=Salmonirosea aquatica TaxID=2654236 RepID=A0A7C9FQH8_9BACT|nr:hypothetical protein [Cytophagaceae bacterium SJW1-29]
MLPSHLNHGLHFVGVWFATCIAWLLTGLLLRCFFPDLTLNFFLVIGLVSGLLLALLLPRIHKDSPPVTAASNHPDTGKSIGKPKPTGLHNPFRTSGPAPADR